MLVSRSIPLLLLGASFVSVLAQPIVPQPKAGERLHGLTSIQDARFAQGLLDFDRTLQVPEGLGPIFNQNSCSSCHSNPLGGSGSITVTRFGFFDAKGGGFDPLASLGGSLLQENSIAIGCGEIVPPEANITAERVTTSVLGAGLIEAIPDAQITALAVAHPSGVAGSIRMVSPVEGGGARVGRFGWKAQVATVLTFSADASLNEMGFTNRFFPTEEAPNGNQALLNLCDTVADPEDGPDVQGQHFIDRITDFQRYLAPPPQTPKSGMAGEAIFISIGCAECHNPGFTTSNDPSLETALRGKAIRPYSDFLLHDMGAAADFIEDGSAGMQDVKTPPLWGVRRRDPLWHDGRVGGGTLATRIMGTGGIIELHGALLSTAANSAGNFNALSIADKNKVIAFLDSLGKEEFDSNGDGRRDRVDLLAFQAARNGGPYTPDMPEAVFDVNQDGFVNQLDFDVLVQVYEEDCNLNGVGDLLDILVNSTSPDANGNLIPDECETLQIDLGQGSATGPTLKVAGDPLTVPGSQASVIIEGAAPFADLYWLASLNAAPTPIGGGAFLVPALPLDFMSGPIPADASGRRFVTVNGGGGPVIPWYCQVAAVDGLGNATLSNALLVLTGL